MRGSRPDGWSWIGNFHISCTRVWTKADWRPNSDIWICDSCLKETRVQMGYYIVRMVERSFLYWNLERILDWSSAEISVRTGCWDVRMDASWIETSRLSGGSGRKCTSSGRMMLGLTSVQTGWLDHLDGWQGTEIFDLSLNTKWFCPEWSQNTNIYHIYKLT